MCKKGQRTVFAALYYRIRLKEVTDEIYAAKIMALEKTYANDRKTLQEKVSTLTRDYKAAQLMIDKLAEQNPGAYELDLADTLIPLVIASLLNSKNSNNQQNKAKMEKMLKRAVSILLKYQHVPSAKAKLKLLIEMAQQVKSGQKQ